MLKSLQKLVTRAEFTVWQIRWFPFEETFSHKTTKLDNKLVTRTRRGHSRSSRSLPIKSPYATFY